MNNEMRLPPDLLATVMAFSQKMNVFKALTPTTAKALHLFKKCRHFKNNLLKEHKALEQYKDPHMFNRKLFSIEERFSNCCESYKMDSHLCYITEGICVSLSSELSCILDEIDEVLELKIFIHSEETFDELCHWRDSINSYLGCGYLEIPERWE